MVMLISTFVIAISFTIFFNLLANIFTLLLVDIPATIKLGQKGVLKHEPVLKKYTITISVCSVIVSVISILTYYLFIKYSFGYSISIFIGACLASGMVLWKVIWLHLRHPNNYSTWLDFYMKENVQYLSMFDKKIIAEKLNS